VVGGTGLYFRALTHGLADVPPVPETQREVSALLYAAQGEPEFRDVLAELDPEAEAHRDRRPPAPGPRPRRGHRHRQVADRLADRHQAGPGRGTWRGVILDPPRAALYDRCDARLGLMVEHGALDEVRAMEARGLDSSLPALKAVGYRELVAHLRGEVSLDEALDAARQETRRYAKRQMTWFRNQTPDWARVVPSL
jgi:tRNA dimethylallyltransferase